MIIISETALISIRISGVQWHSGAKDGFYFFPLYLGQQTGYMAAWGHK